MAMDPRIEAVLSQLEREYSKPLTIGQFAQRAGLSPFRIEHLFRVQTGLTFRAKLREIRLTAARGMLADWKLPVKQIAFPSGYTSVSTFSRNFKNRFGKAPSAYRRSKFR